MTIEARAAPSQFVAKLRRVLGGQAGWGGFALQILFVVALAWIGYEIVANARANLASQRIASGFGFLSNTAGFGVSQSLIPYSESDTYTRVFLVGLLNTLLVAVIGIVLATIIGFLVGLGRLSPNWLLSRVAGAYVELVRNLPLLFQILFWYLAVLATLPNPRQSISLFGSFFLSNRGFVIPKPIGHEGLTAFVIAVIIAIAASLALRSYARRLLFQSGRLLRIWPYVLGLLVGLPLLAALLFGKPVTFEIPELKGFNFAGGSRVIPEFVALTLALSTYTGAFIAEIVRAGIQSVHKGQMKAGSSLGRPRVSSAPSFVRQDLVPESPAPVKTTGFVGFVRTRLLNSPTNILLTIASILLIWFTVVPALRFLLVDAVWSGTDRNACLAENAGHPVGACWPFVQAKFAQFMYGFYPELERWR